MSSAGSTDTNLSCPECSSNYTQSISIAYARSIRISDSGYESITAYGRSIAPPQERDERVRPTVVACFTATVCLLFLADLFNQSGIPAISNLSTFSWPVILGSCAIGWTAGLLDALPAIRYNVHVWPDLCAKWEDQMVCNRCFSIWSRSRADHQCNDGGRP